MLIKAFGIVVYNSLFKPYFDYCSEVWDCPNKELSDRLQKLQNGAARLIMNLKNEQYQSIIARKSSGWITLKERRTQMKAKLIYKTVNSLSSQRLCEILKNVSEIYDYNLRGSLTKLYIPKPKQSSKNIVLVIVGLIYGTRCPMRYATRVLSIRFVISFLPRS